MHQAPRSLSFLPARPLLNDEPFWKSPGANASGRLSWIILHGRWRVKPGGLNSGHHLKFAREPRLENLFQITCLWPGVEATTDRRISRQIDKSTRPISCDDLATPDL